LCEFLSSKSVLRYKFLIFGPSHPDILYFLEHGCEKPWLFFEKPKAIREQKSWGIDAMVLALGNKITRRKTSPNVAVSPRILILLGLGRTRVLRCDRLGTNCVNHNETCLALGSSLGICRFFVETGIGGRRFLRNAATTSLDNDQLVVYVLLGISRASEV
jgi:hypothetical protein